jgi:uncharacterized protein YhhL (DUF1145 family)
MAMGNMRVSNKSGTMALKRLDTFLFGVYSLRDIRFMERHLWYLLLKFCYAYGLQDA